MGVTDAATWLSRRFSERSGASLLVSGTVQDAADPDGDGWGDQSRARRWGIRPRYSFNDASGRSLFATAGYGYDDRQGGTLGSARAPDGSPFREGLTGQRADAGLTLRLPRADSGHVAVRLALSTNGRERMLGSGPVERDRISTGFAELTRTHEERARRGTLRRGRAGRRLSQQAQLGIRSRLGDAGPLRDRRSRHRTASPCRRACAETTIPKRGSS